MSPSKVAASLPTLPAAAVDQYYQFISPFILHRYHIEASKYASGGPKRARRRYQRPDQRGVETILVYDVPSLTLSNQPLNRVYGARNLYHDVNVALDVNELEEGLSTLESHASRIIDDLHLYKHGEFMLKRKDLYYLMKYLFIMHYRHTKLSSNYSQEDHTENRTLAPWFQNFREKHRLKTMADVWLYTIRYYMDTPHSLICQHAEEMYQKYGRDVVGKGLIDPNMEHYNALAYTTQAREYTLGFWEASEGTEFILSHNSFGLEEGDCLPPSMTMHRVFVVSPRFAVVLRRNKMLPDTLHNRSCLGSKFADIKQESPRLTLLDKVAENEADIFAFRITQLTESQMQAFNSVILSGVRVDGSITFSSKEYILGIIHIHCGLLEYTSDRPKYEPLIDALCPPTIFSVPSAGPATRTSKTNFYVAVYNVCNLGKKSLIGHDGLYILNEAVGTPGVSSAAEYRALLELPIYKLLQKPIPKPISLPFTSRLGARSRYLSRRPTDANYTDSAEYETPDNEFRHVLTAAMDGSLTFRSRYDKAHRVFAMCNMDMHEGNPFASEVRRLTGFCIANFIYASKPPPDFSPKPHAEIVDSLSTRQSTTFFKLMDELMDKMGVEPGLITLSRFLSDIVALQFLTWIVQNRHDALPSLLPNINVMK